MSPSDEEIVQAVLAGSRQRFAEIISRYQGPVFNLMYRYTRDDQDAADLTQEVFLRAFDRLSTFRDGASFFSWLYAMAVNRANDWSRWRRRRRQGEQSLDREHRSIGLATDPMTGIEQREDSRMLEAGLDRLPPATRELLLLRYRHEQPLREVAAVFALSEGAVKMRIKRGLQQLQDILREMQDDGTAHR